MQGRSIAGLGAILAALVLQPAVATAQERISATKGAPWIHPHTEIAFPPSLGGLERQGGAKFAEDFLDVSFAYSDPDLETEISLYLFRNTLGSAQIWLQQAREAIEVRDIYAQPTLAFPLSPLTAGGVAAAGTLAVYEPGKQSDYTSTAIAFLEIDGWYVKLRASSHKLDPDALRTMVEEAVAELAWPDAARFGGMTDAVLPCPDQLTFRGRSKNVKGNAANALMQGLLGGAMGALRAERGETEDSEPAAPVWCFESTLGSLQNVYRADAASNSYLLAFGDAGRGVTVGPDVGGQLMAQLDDRSSGKLRYQVKLSLPDRDIFYTLQDRLPSPSRVNALIDSDSVASSTRTWGETTIRIRSDSPD